MVTNKQGCRHWKKLELRMFLLTAIVLPCLVSAGYRCSRCNSKELHREFGSFGPVLCSDSDDSEGNFIRSPPESPNVCECVDENGDPLPKSTFDDSPPTCVLYEESDQECDPSYLPWDLEAETPPCDDTCGCFIPFVSCQANKCDYAYQCGDTLYVCWSDVHPHDLGLDSDLCENSEIENVVYCNDDRDFPADEGPNIPEAECGVEFCSMDEFDADMPKEVLGQVECPNGELVQRYIKFCTPNGENGALVGGECIIGEDDQFYCLRGFCDFGTREFTVTQSSIICPDDVSVRTTKPNQSCMMVEYDPVIFTSDSCNLGVVQLEGLPSGSLFDMGTTTNIYQTIRSDDIEIVCSFDVSVLPLQEEDDDDDDPSLMDELLPLLLLGVPIAMGILCRGMK